MTQLIDWLEKPTAQEMYMIAGWRQWADAGSVSSGLPPYLIEQMNARKIATIRSEDFYLFQMPGTHHLLRPVIKLEEGYPKEIRHRKNEVYYTGNSQQGLIIFTGEEPHLHIEQYVDTFFEVANTLQVKRVAMVGGIYGMVPYDKDRNVSCTYSHPYLKQQLAEYAVSFSNYEGGVSLGSYMIAEARRFNMESFLFYAFVPAYDLAQITGQQGGFSIDPDYKAWYDVMKRINHMFSLNADLSDLVNRSDQLIANIDHEVENFDRRNPQLEVRKKLDKLAESFEENSFMPLDDVWARELGDLFGDE